LREIVDGCELITADGQSVVWASRMLGDPLPARVAGIDNAGQINALSTLMIGLSLVILTSAWLRMFFWEEVASEDVVEIR